MRKEVIILSGFLGSGKTTVLQHLIRHSAHKKIAILLNDFGDVPVDGALLAAEGDLEKSAAPVVEIGGGSVFCSCLKEAFVKAMFDLSTSDAERVLVEASGMSDPSGVTRMLELAKLNTHYEDAVVICLFDPQRSLKLARVLEVIARQVKAANVVVLTKSDVTSEEERNKSIEYIRTVNQDVPIIESHNGVLDLANLPQVPSLAPLTTLGSMVSFNTPETRPDSFNVKEFIKDIDLFVQKLSSYEGLLRVKGFANTNKGTVYVTDTPAGIEVTPAESVSVPLTVICMQHSGKALQESVQDLLQLEQ